MKDVRSIDGTIEYEEFKRIFSKNKHVLQEFVLENYDLDTIEEWTQKKAKKLKKKAKRTRGKHKLDSWKYSVKENKTCMINEMSKHVDVENMNKSHILYELGECISAAVDADIFNVYIVEVDGVICTYKPGDKNHGKSYPIGSGTTLAAHCALTKTVVKATHASNKFPLFVPGLKDQCKAICIPLCSDANDLEAVMEIVRLAGAPFSDQELETINSYLVWGSMVLALADKVCQTNEDKILTEFLTSFVSSISCDVSSIDTLMFQVINQCQKMILAERASLFLVDMKTNQLFARLFNIPFDKDEDTHDDVNEERIRFSIDDGVAGYVARSGDTVNLKDVYKSKYFNPGVDQETGYTTKTLYSVPIIIRGQVLGVLQFVNKMEDLHFNKEDGEIIEHFSAYIGLALHHAKIYDKIRKNEMKTIVLKETMAYHNQASKDEVQTFLDEGAPTKEQNIDISSQIFSYYATGLSNQDKVRKALFMYVDLFGLERYNYDKVVNFMVTVKNSYRSVVYHNWSHGFHVANSIYSILKASPGIYTPYECLGLWVGAICHDIDHRGFNNKFMIDVSSPLAGVYSSSTMENHHFNMGMMILQQESNNIFENLNYQEYNEVLQTMKACILATDLALFFPNKAKLANIVKENSFDWQEPEHRRLAMALCMTGSDLNSSSKPWETQFRTSKLVYSEFHEQGDVEKLLGWKPIPLFDRDNYPEVASMQVGFFGGICIPCYDLLCKVMPTVTPMLEQCQSNWGRWKGLADERKLEKEKEAREKKEREKMAKQIERLIGKNLK